VFKGRKVAVFIDGCFWHGCPEHYSRPRTNEAFWATKLRENVARDRRQIEALERSGWRWLRVWEHELESSPVAVLARLEGLLSEGRWRRHAGWRAVQVDLLSEDPSLEHWELVSLIHPLRSRHRVRARGAGT